MATGDAGVVGFTLPARFEPEQATIAGSVELRCVDAEAVEVRVGPERLALDLEGRYQTTVRMAGIVRVSVSEKSVDADAWAGARAAFFRAGGFERAHAKLDASTLVCSRCTFAEMTDLVNTVVTAVMTSGALTTALVWLFKSWISERLRQSIAHEYGEKLESHKAQLAATHQAALEGLRAELRVASAKREVVDRHLHERIAETIAETYAGLYRVRAAAQDYTRPDEFSTDPPKSERRKQLQEAMAGFRDTFFTKRIFLPKTTAESVESFYREIVRRTGRFAIHVEGDTNKWLDVWTEVDEWMENDMPALLTRLEEDFRRHLGHSPASS